MNKDFEKRYLSKDATHWWMLARRDIVAQMLRTYPKHARILDVGCGGGGLMLDLQHAGFQNVTGIDISEESISFCKSQGLTAVYRMDAARVSFPDASFDIIIASDILEHMQDDAAVLREWRRVLADSGVLILFVPAFMFLWSTHDDINHHYRRYTKRMLKKRFAANGLSLKKIGYWNFLLFAPVLFVRLLERMSRFLLRKRDTHDKLSEIGTGFFNASLTRIVMFENACINGGFPLPIGLSIYAVAEKH